MKSLEQLAKDILDKKVYISYPRCVGKNTFYQELRETIEKEQIRRQNENNPTTK